MEGNLGDRALMLERHNMEVPFQIVMVMAVIVAMFAGAVRFFSRDKLTVVGPPVFTVRSASGVVTTIGPDFMTITTADGREQTFPVNVNKTSTFQDGGVLSLAHLHQGQWVSILYARDGRQVRSVQLLAGPVASSVHGIRDDRHAWYGSSTHAAF